MGVYSTSYCFFFALGVNLNLAITQRQQFILFFLTEGYKSSILKWGKKSELTRTELVLLSPDTADTR